VRPHAQDELNPFDDKVAVRIHCPNCGALDWFEWRFLGKLTDTVCGHTWYVGSGFYTAMQIRAIFQTSARFAKHGTKGASGEGAWIGKIIGGFVSLVFGFCIRLEAAIIMIPIQALAGLCQAKKSSSEIATRVAVLAVTLAGLAIGAYEMQHASRPQFQPSQPAEAIVAPAAPITSAPPAVSVEPPRSPVWPVIDTSAPPSNVIQSLGATVTRVQFFESGSTIPPPPMRVYGDRFGSKGTRNINWELDIQHPTHASRTDFTIYTVWYGPGETEITRQSVNSCLQSDWTGSQHLGNANGIAFTPGRYRVDFFVDDGHKVAVGTFEVFEGDAPPSMYIESINARVYWLQFFEGPLIRPNNDYSYASQFSRRTARSINWALELTYPMRNTRADFSIRQVWTKPDGTVDHDSSFPTYVDSGWYGSSPRAGWDDSGGSGWSLGAYRVDLYVDNRKIASGTFEVVD